MRRLYSSDVCLIILTTFSFSFGTTVSFEYDADDFVEVYTKTTRGSATATYDLGETVGKITDSVTGSEYTTPEINLVSQQNDPAVLGRVGIFRNELNLMSNNSGKIATVLFSFGFNNLNNSELKITDDTTFKLEAYGQSALGRYKNIDNTRVYLAAKSNGQWYVSSNYVNIPESTTATDSETVSYQNATWRSFDASTNSLDTLTDTGIKTSDLGFTELGFYTEFTIDSPLNNTQISISSLNVDGLELTAIPEPSTYAFILGSFSLLLCICIRKTKR